MQEGQTSDGRWRMSSSVIVCNTGAYAKYVTHQGAARDGGPVVLRPVREGDTLLLQAESPAGQTAAI